MFILSMLLTRVNCSICVNTILGLIYDIHIYTGRYQVLRMTQSLPTKF